VKPFLTLLRLLPARLEVLYIRWAMTQRLTPLHEDFPEAVRRIHYLENGGVM
jgi:hypothetical protein